MRKNPHTLYVWTWKGGILMSEVKVNNGNIEDRKREHYEKPSVKRKKKSEAARKRKF